MISALILAAGQSRRMGRPKMLLPWGDMTVLGQVISTYKDAGVVDILAVTGSDREMVEEVVIQHGARSVFNASFASGEMLSSLQCGLRLLLKEKDVEAALIGLGDQPQIQAECIRQVCQTYQDQKTRLVVPSFEMRRGHPWLAARGLWEELLALSPAQSPRDFLNRHSSEILYVPVDSSSILADLDTPQDYQSTRP